MNKYLFVFLCALVIIIAAPVVTAGTTCADSGYNVCGNSYSCADILGGAYPAGLSYCQGKCPCLYSNNCDTTSSTSGCSSRTVPAGYNSCDLSSNTVCGAESACDGIDNNCNGQTDETWPLKGTSCDKANNCGATNTGTYVCNAMQSGLECTATAPSTPTPFDKNTPCTSAPNNCGQTASGTYQCTSGTTTDCNAVTPADGNCCNPLTRPAPQSCGDCGTKDPVCSGTTWTYTGASCSATGNTQPQTCLASNGCSGLLTQTCTLQGSNYNWVSGSCISTLNNCAGTCTAAACCSLNTETCNGADDNCNGQIDETWKVGTPKLTDVCTETNICGTNTGAQVCTADSTGITCSVLPPSMPLNYGTPCNSLPNNCGTTTPGTITCDGSCSATKPADVASCCAGTPASRACTDPNCGTQTQICSGSAWTYTGASCAGNGATVTQPCTINGCSGTQSRVCQFSGLWTEWSVCIATNPQQETCNGVDDNCDGIIDNGLSFTSKPCTVGVGACQRTGTQTQVCNGVSGLGWGACSVSAGLPTTETCNTIDDNCDGTVDEWPTCNVCGDNRLGGSEQCDDGNTVSGDGCSATCRTEGDGSCNSLCGLLFPACQSGFSCEWSGIVQRCRNAACSTDATCGCCTQSGCNDNNECTNDACTTGVGCGTTPLTGASCGTNTKTCLGNLAVTKNYACSATGSCDDVLAADDMINCNTTGYCSGLTNACATCAANTGNCDQANGNCETNLLTNNAHCGSCGNVCGAGTNLGKLICATGSCVECTQPSDCVNPKVCNSVNTCVIPDMWWGDTDNDTYGNPSSVPIYSLTKPLVGIYADNSADCNDANAAIKPTAIEICDNVDNNCINGIDENCDKDNDTYADSGLACVGSFKAGNGLIYNCATNSLDCNDNSNTTHPGAQELCGAHGGNSIDENCNGNADEALICSFCGDNLVNTPNGLGITEECDDGNTIDSDGCSAICMNTTCAITGLTITPLDCADKSADEKICTTGNTLNISITYSGADCAKANIVQVDYHDQNRSCMITTTSTQILGITKPFFTEGNGTYTFTYTFPNIPTTCSGAPLKQAEAGLYTGNIANAQTTWAQRTNSIAPFPGITPTIILYDASQLCTATCPEAAILAAELGTYSDIATAVNTNPAVKQKFMNYLANENCFTRSAQKLRNTYCGFEKSALTGVITYRTNTTVKIGLPSPKDINATCTVSSLSSDGASTIAAVSQSGSGYGQTLRYEYIFGDGNTTTSTDPYAIHHYTVGTYTPSIVIIDRSGVRKPIECPTITITDTIPNNTSSFLENICGNRVLNSNEYCEHMNASGSLPYYISREQNKVDWTCAQLFSNTTVPWVNSAGNRDTAAKPECKDCNAVCYASEYTSNNNLNHLGEKKYILSWDGTTTVSTITTVT